MIRLLFDHKSRRSPAGFPAGKFGFPAQSLGMGEPGFFEKGVPQQMTVGIRNIWEYDDTALDLVNLWYFQSSPTSAGDKMN